ncbi:MAG: hypothetical protein AAF849_00205 [Bacteroidota bacterium]
MKNTFFLLFALFTAPSLLGQSSEQHLITLVEESTTGKFKDTIPYEGAAIVDINSRILVKVNIAELEDQMFRFQGIAAQDNRLAKLRKLNELMRNQNDILSLLNDKFMGANSANAKLSDYQAFARLVDATFEEIENDDEIIEIVDSEATERRFNREGGNFALLVFDILGEKAQAIRESLLESLAVDGKVDSTLMIYFRLGAHIKNKTGGRPIHIENFDDLTTEEYIEVSRFGTPISEEEEKALFRNKEIQDSIGLNMNSLGGHLKSTVKAKVDNLFPSDTTKVRFTKLFKNSLDLLNKDISTRPAAQVLLENEINLERVSRLYRFAAENFETFANLFPSEKLLQNETYTEAFDDLGNLVKRAYEAFHGDYLAYSSSTSFGSEIPGLEQLTTVDNSYEDFNQKVQNDIGEAKTMLGGLERLLQTFRKSYVENEDFTEDVRRFTVGKIPSNGYIELKGIGERRAGDEILIRAIIERGQDKSNPNYEDREIYRRYVEMARISPHLKMAGTLVLASPYRRTRNADVTLENQFQFAPSYGIFMKWGSRKNKFYNDFLMPGVGVGFSSPDFNLDGTPEFGAGVMLTAFRDILSVGWSWNFGVDSSYGFIGFNVPFTVGGVPGLNSATGFVSD